MHVRMDVPNKCKSLITFSTEMDFSLLASDMQKLLSISPKINVFGGRPSEVLSDHPSESKKLKPKHCAYLEDIQVHKCPLCSSNFNSKDILARHALRVHHKAVVAMLLDGSTEQHLKCRFCVHKVMHRHQKLLLLHLEKKHAVELVAFLKQSWMPLEHEMSQGLSTVGFLQKGLQGISLSNCDSSNSAVKDDTNTIFNLPESLKSMYSDSPNELMRTVENSCCLETTVAIAKLQNTADQTSNHSLAKRKLNLDGSSDCRSAKVFLMKENIPPQEPLSTTLASSGWKHSIGKHFACGRCKEAFSCNALLLDHVSVRHRGPLRLLQPLFTCGLCSASFYKNSFLVRHCYQHHTPK